jgi:hypothetical protein
MAPRRCADAVDDDVRPAAGQLLDACRHVVSVVVERRIGAELDRTIELVRTGGGDNHARAKCLRNGERCRRNPTADPPDEDPFSLLHIRLRCKHSVGRFEHERKRRRRGEVELVRKRIHL